MPRRRPIPGPTLRADLGHWMRLTDEALVRRIATPVRIEHPRPDTWRVRYGVRLRRVAVVARHRHATGTPEEHTALRCSCYDDARRYRGCWHLALVCHQYGLQVPVWECIGDPT